MAKEQKKETIKIGLGLILGWVFGAMVIIAGLFGLTDNVIGGLLIILSGVILLPRTHDFIKDKFHLEFSGWLRIVVFVVLFIVGISLMGGEEGYEVVEETEEQPECLKDSDCDSASICSSNKCKKDYDLEMTSAEIFNEFKGLSDLQVEEKIKEFKGKRIKTSLYTDNIDKASLSSQYVAMETYEYPYNLMPAVKAFFPPEEKDKLLEANIGDTIVFSGEFVTYNKGPLTDYIEFTKSKVIEVKSAE
ncbi:MAG: hypothetical protein Q7S55_04420 [Nanoarchaeota archaeon]|nr:hypothetical protein [Nanoarchaeota archaeon]